MLALCISIAAKEYFFGKLSFQTDFTNAGSSFFFRNKGELGLDNVNEYQSYMYGDCIWFACSETLNTSTRLDPQHKTDIDALYSLMADIVPLLIWHSEKRNKILIMVSYCQMTSVVLSEALS